jgi:PHP domain-containing protein
MEHITTGRDTTGRGRADLHVHTLYSDGGQSPEAIVRAAAGRLDVVGITDHDRVGGALRGRDYAREHPELGVDVVVGEEISTLDGHLIGLYLSERVPPGLPARETIRPIHDQGGLAVAAHPFHPLRGVVRGHGSAFTTFPGHDAAALCSALEAGQTRARVEWSWTAAKRPRHVHIQSRSAIRFLQGGHRGHS